MKSCEMLPHGYVPLLSVDLQKNKRLALLVNIIALVIAAVMVTVAVFFVSPLYMFDMSVGLGVYFLRLGVMLGGMLVYIVIHELMHGIFIRVFTGKPAKYGFTGLYAFAGSNFYFGKWQYLVIALSPVVILGLLIWILNILVPISWFWVVFVIQITNLSGAAGDFYVTVRFVRLPKDILVRDVGVAMTVYAPENTR